MPRHDAPTRFGPPPTIWRGSFGFAAIALILLTVGIGSIVGILVIKADSTATVERLERVGVPVEANLSRYDRGRRLSSTVWLHYGYGGTAYSAKVECDDVYRCDPQHSRTLPITINPSNPTELVTVFGATQNSARFLDNWGLLIGTSILTAFGSLSAFLFVVLFRQERRERAAG
ncbi:DUF3592 domain-containing protein [Actinoplanes solisilvae]|uniref:DUF3592 domain-containing protein n=1 Tax=Actinoplanes solisilvae TaxID=2486853 RepID=UPI000FD6F79E|nr:DUF3592 domain-containing protein [Actinoplanes solisilvae]